MSPAELDWLIRRSPPVAEERAKVDSAAELLGVERDVVLALHAVVDMEDALTRLRKAVFHIDT